MTFEDSSEDYNTKGHLFIKKLKEVQKKDLPINPIVRDYKILLVLCILNGLPFSPSQLTDSSTNEDMGCIVLLCIIFNILRTIVCIFSLANMSYLFSVTSFILTVNVFNVCSLIISWYLMVKRHKILQAMRLMFTVVSQVNSRKFKSTWNIFIFLSIYIIGVASIASTLIASYFEIDETPMNITSFMSIEIKEEYKLIYTKVASISLTVTYTFNNSICGIVMLINSTIYFHFGDILSNFGIKLKRRFEKTLLTKHSLSENVEMFQRIIALSQSIGAAVSTIVVFFYGATICIFFNAIIMGSYLSSTEITTTILTVAMFFYGIVSFFIVTLTGNRVSNKYGELQDCLVECSRIVIRNCQDEKIIASFSLICQDIQAADLCMTAGNMFYITNGLMLTIGGTLITYGVLIFQMDR